MSDCPVIAKDSLAGRAPTLAFCFSRHARSHLRSLSLSLSLSFSLSLSLSLSLPLPLSLSLSLSFCRYHAPLVDGSPANGLCARGDASTGHRLPLIHHGFYFRSRVQSRISVTDEADLPRATNRRRVPRWIIAYSFECLASH